MTCLKVNLEAMWQIWGNRGSRGRRCWYHQRDMNGAFPDILGRWERVVHSFTWSEPAVPHKIFSASGYDLSFWRTAKLQGLDPIVIRATTALKRLLHGRQRALLRAAINGNVRRRETSRLKGKIGRAIRSILLEDRALYPIGTLRISEAEVISHGTEIHRTITSHFEK